MSYDNIATKETRTRKENYMSTISYMLEVYEPGSINDVISSYSAETPFPTISKGDILDFIKMDGTRVRATEIIHLVWENDNRLSFKTMIYTENAPA